MLRRGFLALPLGLFLVMSPPLPQARAADAGAGAVELPEVLISPRRIPGLFIDPDTFPGNATVITAAQIRASGASTIQEVLRRAEGVTVMDVVGSGLGSDASVNLRGISNGSRTNALVLVNGVRQNRVTGDEVHWQAIPLGQIERIEIIRGGSGTIYGEGALAGVINIFTRQDSDHPLEASERTEFGSYGWQKHALDVRGAAGAARYGVSVDRQLLDGYRDFSQSRNTTVTGHGGLELAPGTQLSFNALHSADTTEYPGGLKLAEIQQRRTQSVRSRASLFDDETNQASLDLVSGPHEGLTWMVNGFWRDQVVDSRLSNLFTNTPSRGMSLRMSHELATERLDHILISGVELSADKASTGERGGARTDESTRRGYGLYAEETLTLWDRLSLVAGFRYDRSRFEEDIVAYDSLFNPVNFVGTLAFEGKTPKLGAAYELLPKRLTLFTNFSRPFKAPNIDDFASRSPEFQGNVSLRPQQGNAYEAGARARLGAWQLTAAGFYTRIDDEILFVQGVPGNAFIFQNQNHDTQRGGLETAARFALPAQGLRGYATYTYVDALFRKGDFEGQRLPGTPAHTLNAGLGVSPLRDAWVDLDWEFTGDMVRINDVTNTLPGRSHGTLNLLVQYDLPPARVQDRVVKTHAFVKILNVTNQRYTEFQSSNGSVLATGAGDNPMPPIRMIGGVQVEF